MDVDTQLEMYVTVDYHQLMDSFGAPGSWPAARPRTTNPVRRLRDVIEPIGQHAYFSPATNAALAKVGLAYFPGYVWGRVAGIGDPPAEVVAAALPVFHPRAVTAVYAEARRHCGRAGFLATRDDATIASLSEILGGVDVNREVSVLRRGLEAVDGCGRMLFSGLSALPWPDDPVGQLWRACTLLQEYRGDSHIAVWVGAGLSPVDINVLTELWQGLPLGVYTGMRRGWSAAQIEATVDRLTARGLLRDGTLTAAGHEFREDIENRTDALDRPILDAIGDDFEPTVAVLDAWSAAIAASGAFPPGTYRPDRA